MDHLRTKNARNCVVLSTFECDMIFGGLAINEKVQQLKTVSEGKFADRWWLTRFYFINVIP